MKPAIVVVGSLNMDFVVRVERLPEPGETVLGRQFQTIPGGKGANQACAAGRLGVDSVAVKMIGRVGYDPFGDQLKASLAAAGVDVSGVHATRAQPTGVALIAVDAAGQNSIVVASGANRELAAGDVESMRDAFRGARIALFQLENPLETIAAGLKLAREEGLTTILDPAPAQPLPADLLRHVDILTPNEGEALGLLGVAPRQIAVEEAAPMAKALLDLGPRTVVLKLGSEGCYCATPEASAHHAGFAVNVVDTTAAGDTFNAGLAIALAEGKDFAEALRFANAAAAISVTRAGAQASAPSRGEVDALLKRGSASNNRSFLMV